VESARRAIYVTNPYFLPDETMTQALLRARRRGVRVVALVPGLIDHNLVRHASRADFGRLLLAGIEIYEYRAALLHAKTMVVDSLWATVGSTNLDNRSFALNAELNLTVHDAGVAEQLARTFFEDIRRSERITYDAWKARGIAARALELISEPIRNLL
jgi:cardiolipin synthase